MSGALTVLELHNSLVKCVQYVQGVAFENEVNRKVFSKPLRKLNAFIDENGILRVGGRLKYSHLSYDNKHPMLLPRKSPLTLLIIEYYHKKYFHAGAGLRALEFLIAQKFWILSPKRTIRSVLSRCEFWNRWHREYLHTLQQRSKWLEPSSTPEIGTLVLIKNDNSPPCQWLLGRIVSLSPGLDGVARVASVKTANGQLTRPLVKLCPLPVA
ncbi:hypothetical protein NQ317_005510 [Molorchus minor]|uniref:DUF5641 domain-containing protein n=1 Tax=Molorchus minor TaxID=1323400 RepID=A0ABQ9ISM0_9CUCU|nr:hypothetical protein NQ317_005510 [Molorchus minor]